MGCGEASEIQTVSGELIREGRGSKLLEVPVSLSGRIQRADLLHGVHALGDYLHSSVSRLRAVAWRGGGFLMSGWIKFDKDMANDPRLAQAATLMLEDYLVAHRSPMGGQDMSAGDASRFVTHALRGALVTLWCYADEHIRDDDSLPCDVTTLDGIIGLDGFCELLPDQWLTIRADGKVVLPDYCAKNGVVSKRKTTEKTAERTRQWRARKKGSGSVNSDGICDVPRDASLTPSQRASRSHHGTVTKTADLDQDLREERIRTPETGNERKADGETQRDLLAQSPEPAARGSVDSDRESADPDLDPEAYLVWTSGLTFLGGDSKRSLLGKLIKQYGRTAVATKLSELMRMTEPPRDPAGYLVAAMRKFDRGAVC